MRERCREEGREMVNATRGITETEVVGGGREKVKEDGEEASKRGMSEKDRGCMDEGLMRDAGYGTRRGTMGGWKRSKPSSPDGERRENEDGGSRSMTPITLPSSTSTIHRNPDTLDVAYRDDDRKNGRSDVRWRTYSANVVGAPERRTSRCHGAREQGRRWRDFRSEEKESALQISSRGDEGDTRERERESGWKFSIEGVGGISEGKRGGRTRTVRGRKERRTDGQGRDKDGKWETG